MAAAHEADAKMGEDRKVDPRSLKPLQSLVATLTEDPALIHAPELAFFKDFLQRWEAKLPEPPRRESPKSAGPPSAEVEEPEESTSEEPEESEEPEDSEEPEEEDPDRLPEDPEPYPELGPSDAVELSANQLDAQVAFKQAAAEAWEAGKIEEAMQKLTEAIKIGNPSAIMYAKRGETLLKLRRPKACIADCTAAIGVNPDSGKAYRIRGKAYRALGRWEESHRDLSMGQQLDYDENTVDVHRFVDEKWKKISERMTRKRVREEAVARKKREHEIKRRRKAAQRAQEKARAYQEAKAKEAGGAATPEAKAREAGGAATPEDDAFDMGGGDAGGAGAAASGPSTPGPRVEEVPPGPKVEEVPEEDDEVWLRRKHW